MKPSLSSGKRKVAFLFNPLCHRCLTFLASSYAASSMPKSQKSPQSHSNSSSYLAHFSSTTPDSPSKRARLRLILFLAGSQLYDPAAVKSKIEDVGRGKSLALESAIVEGKVNQTTYPLAFVLTDTSSSETTNPP
jgi:hypothetical protein